MFELVCVDVAGVALGWLVDVSGILAMKGHVRSSMIVSVSDCCLTDLTRTSDSCLHLAIFVSSVLGSWIHSWRLMFIWFDLEIRSLLRVRKESTLSLSWLHL